MCAVSMVMDHYTEKWRHQWPQIVPTVFTTPPTMPATVVMPEITRAEFDELKREVQELKSLLKRAKEYDERTGQPDCETTEKAALVRKLAELVGVDLSDVVEV